jgi:uncharacterized protein
MSTAGASSCHRDNWCFDALSLPPTTYILLKLAARCNISCSYCYWFRDESVMSKPKVLLPEVEEALIDKLRRHIKQHELSGFSILFHGGEPLLFGKDRFDGLCQKLRRIEAETSCCLRLAVTTNGLLIDREWCTLFKEHKIAVTVSLDEKESHDRSRVDFRGAGTFSRVVAAIKLLREESIEPGVLAVANPVGQPADLLELFVDSLEITGFDVLIPDATHEDHPASVAAYYRELFDLWLDTYSAKGVRIRVAENLILGLTGIGSRSETFGYGPVNRLTILTDGSMETLDVLRISGTSSTSSNLNVMRCEINDIYTDPLWREILWSSLNLSKVCQDCDFKFACGGGHIASRWSRERRYDNPSVYCADLTQIFRHVWSRISGSVFLESLSVAK